jgi:TPR repeat protein
MEPRSVENQVPMNNVTSAPLKITLIAALLCTASMVLPCAHAQPSDTDRQALAHLRAKAETGDAGAQINLGVCYYDGMGVAKDYVEAVKWFRQAAEQNDAKAQNNLASCYLGGQGVAKDAVVAVKWFRRAAEQNDVKAQNSLGGCYAMGQGAAKDEVEAVKWYRKAAEQRNANAQFNLGGCYDKGRGVSQDYTEAVKWYRQAAEQNYAQAQFNLGVCYEKGRGVAKDEVEAVHWYRKAATGGAVRGLNNVAWILAVSQNPAIRDGSNAVVFAEKAVAATHRKVPTNLDTLAAAYAEVGQFEKAVSTQREAIALLKTGVEKENDYQSRLRLYEARKPYRAED